VTWLKLRWLIHVFLCPGDLSKLKDASFTIAEGRFYQLRISFYVQREIVTGLKYVQQSYRAGIRGTQETFMYLKFPLSQSARLVSLCGM